MRKILFAAFVLCNPIVLLSANEKKLEKVEHETKNLPFELWEEIIFNINGDLQDIVQTMKTLSCVNRSFNSHFCNDNIANILLIKIFAYKKISLNKISLEIPDYDAKFALTLLDKFGEYEKDNFSWCAYEKLFWAFIRVLHCKEPLIYKAVKIDNVNCLQRFMKSYLGFPNLLRLDLFHKLFETAIDSDSWNCVILLTENLNLSSLSFAFKIALEKNKDYIAQIVAVRMTSIERDDLAVIIKKGFVCLLAFIIERYHLSANDLNTMLLKEEDQQILPLALAARYNQPFVIDCLVHNGCLVDEGSGSFNSTPLMFAAEMGSIDAALRLCHFGANVKLKNKWKNDALYFARSSNNKLMLTLIKQINGEADYEKHNHVKKEFSNGKGKKKPRIFYGVKNKLGNIKKRIF